MRLALDLMALIVFVGIIPVAINKSTEIHFDWAKRYLREIWTGIFVFFAIYWLFKPEVISMASDWHKNWHGWTAYAAWSFFGAVLFSGFWYFTGKVAVSSNVKDSNSAIVVQLPAV